jgi:DNA-binding NarL/FixJ family response regulator
MIKVLIADDHPVVRRGIRQILGDTPDLVVSGESGDAEETLSAVKNAQAEVLLLDLSMPGTEGLDLLQQIKREHPALPVLVLTMHTEQQFGVRAMKLGASGYLRKESAPNELVAAVRKVHEGGRYISEPLAERLAAQVGPDGGKLPHERLSDREYQVLTRIAVGRSTREISTELTLSMKTVATYRARIFEKMRIRSNAELAAYAVRHNLTD